MIPATPSDRQEFPPRERPWVFGLLIGPYGVLMQGLIQGGVIGYLLSLQGVGSGMQSHLIGLLALPSSLYFLWSPITDFFVRRRTWLLGASATAAVLMFLGLDQPQLSSQGALVLMLLGACCSQLVVSSAGGMMGALLSERGRRTAAASLQAGAMGCGAVSAWLLIYLSSRVSREMLGVIAAALIAVPALAALAAPPHSSYQKPLSARPCSGSGANSRRRFSAGMPCHTSGA